MFKLKLVYLIIFYVYKLKNDKAGGEELANKFEITFIHFDLYFDVLMIGDSSSNVRFFEKILQLSKSNSQEENLPFFSMFYDGEALASTRERKLRKEYHYDLPIFSVSHDVIKDRCVIIYDQGRDLVISKIDD